MGEIHFRGEFWSEKAIIPESRDKVKSSVRLRTPLRLLSTFCCQPILLV
jgi:hypothetical protein